MSVLFTSSDKCGSSSDDFPTTTAIGIAIGVAVVVAAVAIGAIAYKRRKAKKQMANSLSGN